MLAAMSSGINKFQVNDEGVISYHTKSHESAMTDLNNYIWSPMQKEDYEKLRQELREKTRMRS